MWKLSRRGARTCIAALTLGGVFLAVPASVTLACDDDGPAPVGWGQYPAAGPSVVVVEEPRYRDERREHWRHERAARRYWQWRGREQAREQRHHDRRWD